jgi:hypothetical protein
VDLALVPEVEARQILHGERIALRMLAPYGVCTGSGKLRVLRSKRRDGEIELTVGYESYGA